jgi:hypothetical protein
MTQVSRDHVRDVLRHASLTPEQEESILALSYPADLDQALAMFARYGVTTDLLISRMGGSP